MLYINSTENLIGLQDLIIKEIETDDKEIHIFGQLERKQHKCPCCGVLTDIPTKDVISRVRNKAVKKYYNL